MQRLIFFSFCVWGSLLIFSLSALQAQSTDTNFIDKKGRRQGPWRQIDTTGMSYEGQFKDNRPYGTFRYFDKEQRTLVISSFFRNGYASKTTYFYPDGRTKAEGYYLDKVKDSTWKYYSPYGVLIKEENYQSGMLQGLTRLFDNDSQCIETQMWYRGLRHGQWWEKSDKGTQTTTYKLNLSHGKYTARYPNDSLFIDGEYVDGRKEGVWTFYYADGTPEKYLYFRRNNLLKKEVALQVGDETVRLCIDTVAVVQTNGRQCLIRVDNGREYRCMQEFAKLLQAFDTDNFLLANGKVLVNYKDIQGLQLLPNDETDPDDPSPLPQRALLLLKIDYPYEIILDEEAIGLLQTIRSSNPVGDEK